MVTGAHITGARDGEALLFQNSEVRMLRRASCDFSQGRTRQGSKERKMERGVGTTVTSYRNLAGWASK